MNKTVVVTGGCGYIGSHVARAFKENGDRVFIIDNVKREHTLKNIDGWFIDDFASDAALSSLVHLFPDVIVHCAGTSLVGPSLQNPGAYYDNNIAKTIKLLNVVKDLPKKPYILFSSSASVYGLPNTLPIRETAKLDPISPYGSTKAMTERILYDYRAYGLQSICFRYFNAAGAEPRDFDLGQEPGATHLIARAIEASLYKMPITIYGQNYGTTDGTCIRDYVHVWDIAQAHVQGVEYLDRDVDLVGDVQTHVFNLGTNKGISNKEIVSYIDVKYGLTDILIGANRPGDPAALIADATDARQFLGWVPHFSNIGNIIDSAYKWYTRT